MLVWYLHHRQRGFHYFKNAIRMSKLSRLKGKRSRFHRTKTSETTTGESNQTGNNPQGKQVLVRTFAYPNGNGRCCTRHSEANRRSGMSTLSPGGLGFYRIRRPWWLWLFGFADIILVFIVAYSISIAMLEDGFAIFQGQEIFIFILLIFSSLVQISMGTGLLCGLCSEDDFTTASSLQGWLYGAYILLIKTCYFLAVDIVEMNSMIADDVGMELGTIIGNCIGTLRVIAVIMVQCYLDDFRTASCAIRERKLHDRLREMLMEEIQDPRSRDLLGEYDHDDL